MKNLLRICLIIVALLASAVGAIASDLPPCPSSGYFHNCFGTYTYADGRKYVGEFKDDKFFGQGTYTYANGDKYVGGWKDDKINGQGTFTYGPNSEWAGDKYVGEYKNDERNGFGVYFHGGSDDFTGDRDFGTFVNGELSSGLYVKRNGRAAFLKNWKFCDKCITDNAHNVLPVLKQAFNLLDKQNRRIIQNYLKNRNVSLNNRWSVGKEHTECDYRILSSQNENK